MMMRYSKSALKVTETFEACRCTAYQDEGGVWTIGFGHTRDVLPGMQCTPMQAEAWLLEDISTAEQAVNRFVYASLTQGEFDALVDFVFNVGVRAFSESTMLKLLNVQNYMGAANELQKWCHVSGHECAGLLRRRQAEERMFNSEGAD
jgi:lysozyme